MTIDDRWSDDAVLAELGRRLARWRLERNLAQERLAQEAGVVRRTVQRIEAGEPVALTSFIRVLRALELLESLERLVPEPPPSPLQRLKLAGRERRRARRSGAHEAPAAAEPGVSAEPWRWGDEDGAR